MAPKNQNKPPSSPSSSKYQAIESIDKGRRVAVMKRPPNLPHLRGGRQALAPVNGTQDPLPSNGPSSTAGSDCGIVEFTKEEVEALLNEKLRPKNKFNTKEKCELMSEYIRKLKQCIKWFQQLEGNYVSEQEDLRSLLESAERRCSEMENLMKGKEEELHSIIEELKRGVEALQEKSANEESGKLEALDSLCREKEARAIAERIQGSLSDELKRAQQDNASSTLKIQSLNDMYTRLQEYNTSLQQYNSKLQTELAMTNETLKRVEKEKAAVVENLSTLRGHYTSIQEQLMSSKAKCSLQSTQIRSL